MVTTNSSPTQGFLAPSETVKHAHQRVVMDLCYDFSNQTKIAQIPIAATIDPIFCQYKEVCLFCIFYGISV